MKVLVYGTLKKGFSNHAILHDAELVKSGEFKVPFCNLRAYPDSGFPFLFNRGDQESHAFIGEIYEINDEHLQDMDYLEGHPNFYERIFIDSLDCYTYVFKHDDVEDMPIIKEFK